jgi:predicted nuclease of predicted toxin-antitoxin system
MRLLLDQGLPRSAVALLAQEGVDAVHVGDIRMASAEDQAILDHARSDNRVAVTLDADFHTLLALSNASRPSVVRVRIEGLKAEGLTRLLRQVLSRCADDLDAGAMVSVDQFQIRVHRLPVLRANP